MAATSNRRRWTFRVLAIALGLLPFAVLEAGLRAFDLPRQPVIEDPWVDLHQLRPLFVPTADGSRREIPTSRFDYFRPASFATPKPAGEFRIFALGGSTVQGRPYATETSFTSWLELSLQAAAPKRSWSVINCGGVSYASYRVAAILDEVLAYEPDLVILYTGHNEFLEDRTYRGWKRVPRGAARALSTAGELRIVQLGRQVASRLVQSEPAGPHRWVPPAEVDARLDHVAGLEAYVRDADWREAVLAHFDLSFRQMLERCRTADVPVIICTPVSNLRNTPPFKVTTAPGLSAAELQAVTRAWGVIQDPDRDAEQRIASCRQLLRIDPQHAGAAYVLGRLLLDRQDVEQAAHWLTVARDWDVCPLRAPTEIIQIVHQRAVEADAPVVDVVARCSLLADAGLVGDDLLLDHVHPNLETHQRIAQWLLMAMAEEGIIALQQDWEQRQREAYAAHLATLGEEYFARGRQRLAGLRQWAAGRSGAAGLKAAP